VIGRALERDVERDLDAVCARRGDELAQSLDVAQCRVDGVVTALRRPDGPWTAHVVVCGAERVVRALAFGAPDRMDRGQIQNVEPHAGDVGKMLDHVVERAVATIGTR
jgi:hypothetical protein